MTATGRWFVNVVFPSWVRSEDVQVEACARCDAALSDLTSAAEEVWWRTDWRRCVSVSAMFCFPVFWGFVKLLLIVLWCFFFWTVSAWIVEEKKYHWATKEPVLYTGITLAIWATYIKRFTAHFGKWMRFPNATLTRPFILYSSLKTLNEVPKIWNHYPAECFTIQPVKGAISLIQLPLSQSTQRCVQCSPNSAYSINNLKRLNANERERGSEREKSNATKH